MDVCITPSKRYEGLFLVATTDFFYPLCEDPYLQGQVACANVLSDMYAQGITNIDNVLMILGVSDQMPPDERFIATHLMMKGFADLVHYAGGKVTGGQTIINSWPILGGCAKSIGKECDFIRPDQGLAGDVLILTKPLGTQPAAFMRDWSKVPCKWERAAPHLTLKELDRAFKVACASMARLNLNAAILMHKYKAHSGTDITGFGLMGDSNKLAHETADKVELIFHTLPIIKDMAKLDKPFPFFKLLKGFAPETSGALLIMIPAENADAFCRELEEMDGWPCFQVGHAIKRTTGDKNFARIVENPTIIEV
uniref:Selenide, water dikinase n=2 Tax=Hirondellea gigas TaxID=1518452 RepID=A0A6A7G7H4_9CRUS